MEMHQLVQRYLGRRVEVMVHSYSRIAGEVASVFEECVRLIDTTIYDELDSKSWQTTGEPETIISLRSITAITCLDDKLRDEPPPGASKFLSAESEDEDEKPAANRSTDPVIHDRIELFLGVELVRLASPQHDGDLLEQIGALRKEISRQLGIEIPLVRVRDDLTLPPESYTIWIQGVERGRGELQPDKHLAVSSAGATAMRLAGEAVQEPVFGADAWWIGGDQCELASTAGYTVVSPSAALVTHLRHSCVAHAAELLTLHDTWVQLNSLYLPSSKAASIIQEKGWLLLTHRALTSLLAQQISIARLPLILERLVKIAARFPQPESGDDTVFYDIPSQLRIELRDLICAPLLNNKGVLEAATLSDTEMSLLTEKCHINTLADHHREQRDFVRKITQAGVTTLLVEDAQRQQIADIIRTLTPAIHVVARSEISPSVQLQIVETSGTDPAADTPSQPR